MSKQDVASANDGLPSDSSSSISSSENASNSIKGTTIKEPVLDQATHCPPTSCYGYYYPGYDTAYSEWNHGGYFHARDSSGPPYSGVQYGNGSHVYYVPGYNPYTTGSVDGQCVGQQYFSSSGSLQAPVSYGSEAVPPYSLYSKRAGEAANITAAPHAGPDPNVSVAGLATSVKSKELNSVEINGSIDTKVSALSLDSKAHPSTASNKFSRSTLHNQLPKSLSKGPHWNPDFRSSDHMKGYRPSGKFSSFSNRELFTSRGTMNCRPNDQIWQGGGRFNVREKFNKNGGSEAWSEPNRGPRARRDSTPLSLLAETDQLGIRVRRDQYNLQDFHTEYENAKFFIIKSFSEDDVHKSIKYDVWASTPNGNKKLDAAFHDAEMGCNGTSAKCPVFLFFSVNGSGQFVGLAEMIGKVDFKKDMDFWMQDRWNGFFPVKWHIIKDIPNNQLRHIIIENNDNKPVTNSRDTQEIALKQGLQMLNIFKSYAAKTSMLDDFSFYENQEKSLHARRSSIQVSQGNGIDYDNDFENNLEAEEVLNHGDTSLRTKRNSDPNAPSLITLTKNLSLNSRPVKRDARKNSTERKIVVSSAKP